MLRETLAGLSPYICADSTLQIDGMSREATGRSVFRMTREATSRHERLYVHDWRLYDLVIIDNFSTLHARVPYDPAVHRLLYRMRVNADVPGEPKVPALS